MPIYDYVCDECGKKFEKLVLKPATDVVDCPACGKTSVTQAISLFAAPVGARDTRRRVHPEFPSVDPYDPKGHEPKHDHDH